MAKKFRNVAAVQTIREVAKTSAEKAQVTVIKMIRVENLHDYPNNREDVDDTIDLENSIKQLGFTDPIEVTSFGQPQGHYMIVSGHRRRAAGVKCGLDLFPCIVREFGSEHEVENYVLLANSQRDSAKDPLLFCKRYKMHEEYLKSSNFQGKIRDEVAKRLGISIAQADRYNTMNKIILPVWDMVREEIVGMSSVLPMASHTEEEQVEIYDIMQEALDKGITLTRDTVKQIVAKYRDGKRSWDEMASVPKDSDTISNTPSNGVLNEIPEQQEHIGQEESRHDDDLSDEETGRTDSENTEFEEQQQVNQTEITEKKTPLTDDEKKEKRAKDILRDLEKLNTYLSDFYTFESKEEAEEALRNMASTFSVVVDEMYSISREYNLNDVFGNSISDLKNKVSEYEIE